MESQLSDKSDLFESAPLQSINCLDSIPNNNVGGQLKKQKFQIKHIILL